MASTTTVIGGQAAREGREVPLRDVFLPQVLGAEGYATGGFYRWAFLDTKYGFGPGFDVYERIGKTREAGAKLRKRVRELRKGGTPGGGRGPLG